MNRYEPDTNTLAETENFIAWSVVEPDGETTYSLQLERATIHFYAEEWDELLASIPELISAKPTDDGMYVVSFDNVDVWMDKSDWSEFKQLLNALR